MAVMQTKIRSSIIIHNLKIMTKLVDLEASVKNFLFQCFREYTNLVNEQVKRKREEYSKIRKEIDDQIRFAQILFELKKFGLHLEIGHMTYDYTVLVYFGSPA